MRAVGQKPKSIPSPVITIRMANPVQYRTMKDPNFVMTVAIPCNPCVSCTRR
jgi:hypothetical protein